MYSFDPSNVNVYNQSFPYIYMVEEMDHLPPGKFDNKVGAQDQSLF